MKCWIFLTGSTGFVGRYLLGGLLKDGYRVVAGCRDAGKLGGFENYGSEQLVIFDGDVSELSDCDYDIDTVIHSAGQSPYNCENIRQYIEGNINLSQRVADYAVEKGVSRLIYLSSMSVYGDVGGEIADEMTDIVNPGLYGSSKWIAENIFEDISEKVPCISLRLPGIQGAGAWSTWLAGVLRKAINGDLIRAYNPDAEFNNAVWLDDLYRFVRRMIGMDLKGYDVLTLGSREPIPVREVIDLICRKTGSKSKVEYIDTDSVSFLISSEKAESEYGYESLTTREMLDRYIESESRQSVGM